MVESVDFSTQRDDKSLDGATLGGQAKEEIGHCKSSFW